ncbi:MAG: matrixin family metalloprotease [Blastocatellia bacterium]|nr:matrixin family metalloprotease [Blastocatellia bacterium]
MYRRGSAIISFFVSLVFTLQAFGTTFIEFQAKDEARRPTWRGPVTIAVSSSFSDAAPNLVNNSDIAGAIARSVQAWREVSPFEIRLVESTRQDVSPSGNAGDGVSLLTIAPTAANTLFFARSDSSPAKTRVFYSRRNVITEADIVLNPAVQFSTDGTYGTFDLEAVLTHEIGHLLGLRHSFVPGSIMYDSIVQNGAVDRVNTAGSISASDVSELRSLYGDSINSDDCCGEVVGRAPTNLRKGAMVEVWAQDTESGLVKAATTVARGRSFRLAGLGNGSYSLYSQARIGQRLFEVRELGIVEIRDGSRSSLQLESSNGRQIASIVAIGVGGVLADRFISLQAGTQSQIMVSIEQGSQVPAGFVILSPGVWIDAASVLEIDHADGVRTFLMNVVVDEAAAKGNHSVCYSDSAGARSCIAGAVGIR